MRSVPQSDFPQSPFLWSRGTAGRETQALPGRGTGSMPALVMNTLSSAQILSDERIQANRSFSSNGLLR